MQIDDEKSHAERLNMIAAGVAKERAKGDPKEGRGKAFGAGKLDGVEFVGNGNEGKEERH
ncbi:hypothetical protein [Aureimonas psammosilenae]|uniref:hypothetical protein n=1 Tax=Aureimonas psammosilenae TaxID=2495496 RepID=UPI0012612F4F|nr:hypothetical protein [Aureimonas psammosilenae]